MFAVPKKSRPIGIDGFAAAIEDIALPVFALGGIGADAIEPLRCAGARGVAVMRAIGEAPDPATAMRELVGIVAAQQSIA